MQKIWKDIPGFDGYYQVSNFGDVKSVARCVTRGKNYKPVNERILKAGGGNKRSYFVILSKNGKKYTRYIHRIVAEAFIPNPNNLPVVNHKDENPLNNQVDNLEWCTWSYNNSYNDLRKRAAVHKRKPILQYSKTGEFIKEWSHAREAAESLNISKRAIYECCLGRSKTSGGYVWKRK